VGAGADRAGIIGYSDGAQVAYALAAGHPDRVTAVVGIGAVGAPDEDPGTRAHTAAAVRARGMRAVMEGSSAREPHPAPRWLIDNLASTPAEMFALELEGWSTAPGPWHYFLSCRHPP
jgi:pimeloyl-ACP methyl ester carboxylesterase